MKNLALFIIGIVLAVFGLFSVIQYGRDMTNLIIGIVCIIIGVWTIKQSGNI